MVGRIWRLPLVNGIRVVLGSGLTRVDGRVKRSSRTPMWRPPTGRGPSRSPVWRASALNTRSAVPRSRSVIGTSGRLRNGSSSNCWSISPQVGRRRIPRWANLSGAMSDRPRPVRMAGRPTTGSSHRRAAECAGRRCLPRLPRVARIQPPRRGLRRVPTGSREPAGHLWIDRKPTGRLRIGRRPAVPNCGRGSGPKRGSPGWPVPSSLG
jgi:hypothetical protein